MKTTALSEKEVIKAATKVQTVECWIASHVFTLKTSLNYTDIFFLVHSGWEKSPTDSFDKISWIAVHRISTQFKIPDGVWCKWDGRR